MKNFLVLAMAVSLLSTPTFSQQRFQLKGKAADNTEAITYWIHQLDREQPFVDSLNPKGSRSRTKFVFDKPHMLISLLRDDHFVPVFGEPFPEMPTDKVKKIGEMMNGYMKDKKYADKRELIYSVYTPFFIQTENGIDNSVYYRQQVKELRERQKEYSGWIERLTDPNYTVQLNSSAVANTANQFRLLLPSEIYTYNRLYRNKTADARYQPVDEKLRKLESAPPTADGLQALLSYKKSQYAFKSVGTANQSEALARINRKITENTAVLMEEERSTMKRLAGDDNFLQVNQYRNYFMDNYYLPFPDSPMVKTTYEQWSNMWLNHLGNQKAIVEHKINAATSIEELAYLKRSYLQYTGADPFVSELNRLLLKKTASIQAVTKSWAALDAQQRAKQRGSPGNTMRFEGLQFADIYRAAHLKDFNTITDIYRQDVNTLIMLFKLLLETYSDSCQPYLPAERVAVPLTAKRLIRVDIIGNRRINVYEEYPVSLFTWTRVLKKPISDCISTWSPALTAAMFSMPY